MNPRPLIALPQHRDSVPRGVWPSGWYRRFWKRDSLRFNRARRMEMGDNICPEGSPQGCARGRGPRESESAITLSGNGRRATPDEQRGNRGKERFRQNNQDLPFAWRAQTRDSCPTRSNSAPNPIHGDAESNWTPENEKTGAFRKGDFGDETTTVAHSPDSRSDISRIHFEATRTLHLRVTVLQSNDREPRPPAPGTP